MSSSAATLVQWQQQFPFHIQQLRFVLPEDTISQYLGFIPPLPPSPFTIKHFIFGPLSDFFFFYFERLSYMRQLSHGFQIDDAPAAGAFSGDGSACRQKA